MVKFTDLHVGLELYDDSIKDICEVLDFDYPSVRLRYDYYGVVQFNWTMYNDDMYYLNCQQRLEQHIKKLC